MATALLKEGGIFDTVAMISAPPAMQPGGYIPDAYKDRLQPITPTVDIAAVQQGSGWAVELRWDCPNPVKDISGETDLFTDAAAVLVPATMNAPWLTMGAPGNPVEAALWRADRSSLLRMHAQGLGTMERAEPPADWSAVSAWENGRWHLRYEFGNWPVLDQFGRIGIAVWRGESQDRGGLKSVTSSWIAVR
jgi:DMSO reductase family type II enzyme heme b subunit